MCSEECGVVSMQLGIYTAEGVRPPACKHGRGHLVNDTQCLVTSSPIHVRALWAVLHYVFTRSRMSIACSRASLYHSLATIANPPSCTSEIMANEKISP